MFKQASVQIVTDAHFQGLPKKMREFSLRSRTETLIPTVNFHLSPTFLRPGAVLPRALHRFGQASHSHAENESFVGGLDNSPSLRLTFIELNLIVWKL